MEPSTHMTFHPDAGLDPEPPNLILISADNIQFHVHRARLLHASSNLFNLLLLYQDSTITLTEKSEVVAIFLHCIYGVPFASRPSPKDILASFDTLKQYGIPPDRYAYPRAPLFEATVPALESLDFAIEIYARAAEHRLPDLASFASSVLLSYPLSSITNDLAVRMGPIYLRKLFVLHNQRVQTLRQILSTPPICHPTTPECGSDGQRRLLMDWDMITAEMIMSATPGQTTHFCSP